MRHYDFQLEWFQKSWWHLKSSRNCNKSFVMEIECEVASSGLFASLSLPKDPERNGKKSLKLASWWFQPIWKTCSSNWIISQNRDDIKNIWNHHRVGGFHVFPTINVSHSLRLGDVSTCFHSALLKTWCFFGIPKAQLCLGDRFEDIPSSNHNWLYFFEPQKTTQRSTFPNVNLPMSTLWMLIQNSSGCINGAWPWISHSPQKLGRASLIPPGN